MFPQYLACSEVTGSKEPHEGVPRLLMLSEVTACDSKGWGAREGGAYCLRFGRCFCLLSALL